MGNNCYFNSAAPSTEKHLFYHSVAQIRVVGFCFVLFFKGNFEPLSLPFNLFIKAFKEDETQIE